MRIRKHFLSLSASITAPIQPSPPLDLSGGDHHNHQQSTFLVQHQEQVYPNDNNLSSLSDPSSKAKIMKELESEKKKEKIKIDVTGKKEISILCAETSSHDNGLFEGDKLIPTKKRSGSNGEIRVNHDDFEEYKQEEMTKSNPKKIKKNEKRGNVIMEGSRCSRVNGRGWRCGQQTIVGYSLCEHHLGKGRLRSMTRVRGHSQKNALKEQETMEVQGKEIETILIDENEHENDDDDMDEEVELISSLGKKKKKKKQQLGVVKERSLSSLLSQIDS